MRQDTVRETKGGTGERIGDRIMKTGDWRWEMVL